MNPGIIELYVWPHFAASWAAIRLCTTVCLHFLRPSGREKNIFDFDRGSSLLGSLL